MEIKINKEIKEYTETMFFGLSVRQFIFALLACGAAVGIYFGCRSFLGTETLSWLCMVGAAPFAALGFIRYNGMTAEQLVRAWFRSEVRMPRRLLFRGTNTLVRAEKRGNMFEKKPAAFFKQEGWCLGGLQNRHSGRAGIDTTFCVIQKGMIINEPFRT